jgi:hypothetical protein
MVLCCWLLLVLLIQEPATSKPAFDQLVLMHGATVEGIVLEETGQQIRFQFLLRKPGVRTLVFETLYERSEVARVIKAAEPGRTLARQLIQKLESSKKHEEQAIDAVTLKPAPWITGNAEAQLYQGTYFELLSTVPSPLMKLVIVRLEAMFHAYLATLGKRTQPLKPLRIFLFSTMAEYRRYQQSRGITLLSPAIYDARNMEIIVGTDLPEQQEQLQSLKRSHQQKLKELNEQRKKIARHYGGQTPSILARQLEQLQQQLQTIDGENESAFAKAQESFLSLLYHEAFHAYLDQWVFPADRYSVPRWLNEGLAQHFENAFVEIEELRVGRMDDKRLIGIQDAIRAGRFMTIRELIQSPLDQFLVRHGSDQFEADRHYLASWALAHFLARELKLLGSPSLATYVTGSSDTNQVARFEALVGMPLAECEERWKQYLLRLRSDGTLRP